jgi:hypothetical protein
MPLLDRKSPSLLAALATFGIGVPATQAAAPRDYEGPQGWSQDGESVPEPPAAAPPAEAAPEAPAEGEFPVEDATPAPAAPPPEDDGGCADGDFCVEDLTTDEEALKKEMAPKAAPKLAGPSGTISGRMRDATSGSPLIGVNVIVVGTEHKTRTDIDGNFTLPVPPGTYQVRIWYDAYEGMTISGVVVGKDETASVNRELRPIAGMTQTVAVTAEINKESAAGKLVERKKSVAARDMMSRDDIRKSGGGSTSAVARRIVGSTVVGGRFLFVRGLGHRYGNTLLDGARLPSPDPNLRTVPLDIFPSGVLSAINVQKTATPDVPADFAGASVQLESREIPEKFTWSLQGMFGMNTATSFRERAQGDRFFGDGVGFGNLGRRLPGEFDTSRPIDKGDQAPGTTDPTWSNKDIERFGEAMPTTRTRVTDDARALPNTSLQGAIGNTFKPWGTELGVFAGVAYVNQRQTLREDIRVFNGACRVEVAEGEPCPEGQTAVNAETPRVDYKGLKTTDNVQMSGLGALKWKLSKHHRVSLTAFYTRDADREARILEGKSRPTAGEQDVRNTRMRYMMRSVLFTRLGGKHEIPAAKGFTIEWFGSYAQARLDDPLLREMLFRRDTSGYVVDQAESGKFQFFRLTDHTGSGGLDFTAPFKQWGGLDARFKFGGWAEGKRRNFGTRAFDYEILNGFEASRPRGTGDILTPDVIGGGPNAAGTETQPFFLREFTRPEDSYKGDQRVLAGYGMLDLPLVRWFKIVGGARFEANDIRVRPYDRFGRAIQNEQDKQATIKDRVALPSASLIFSPTEKMNIRLVGAETLARPEFRELAPFLFTDFVGGFDVQGNTKLRSTRIWNADLRWEWFPSANEVVAVSAFFKYFDAPIERVVGNRATPFQTFRNAKSATNIGVEAELRKNLEFIAKPLRDLSIGANFAYIHSRVELPPYNPDDPLDASTSRVRPMEGQSPWVVNAYLGYDNDRSGTNLRVLYNAFGKRIAFVGIMPLPDIYELPVHTVDLTLLQRLHKGLSLNFGVYNMLNWKQRFTQGGADNLTYQTRRGASFVMGLNYTF